MNESHLGVASVLNPPGSSFTESVSADQKFHSGRFFTAALERFIFDDIATLRMARRFVDVSTMQQLTFEQLVRRRFSTPTF